jgi:SH3 domain protein
MKNIKLYLFVVIACLLHSQGNGLAETMYVTDRLYLSLRSAPSPEAPRLALLPSDTKLDVLEMEGNWATREGDGLKGEARWARVRLENGRMGWVMKRFLVKNVPKSLIIEQLKGQIEEKNTIAGRLREDIASREKQIAALKTQITRQNERFEASAKESTSKRHKVLYVTGIVTLAVGFVIGYLTRRPQRPTIGFLPTEEIRQRILGS